MSRTSATTRARPATDRLPPAVPVLALGIFAMVTSEFAVSGLMPQIADGLSTSVPRVGLLVALFALSMAVGGPLLATLVGARPRQHALLVLMAVFLIGNAAAAAAPSYASMLVARVVTGVASGAFFGIAITAAGEASPSALRPRAVAATLQGLMLGTTLGLPLATFVGGRLGWRWAFVLIGVLTVAAAVAVRLRVPVALAGSAPGVGERRTSLASWRTWAAMTTSLLAVGSAMTVFSYLSPVLHGLSGLPLAAVPAVLVAYGIATVVGTAAVGRLTSGGATHTLVGGLVVQVVVLAVLATAVGVLPVALLTVAGLGLVGVSLNPALVVRVQQVGGSGALLNTLHTSMITLGVFVGSSLGGVGMDAQGLRAPLWLGLVLAVLALVSLTLPVRRPST